jgi:hypothetical protein
MRNWELRLPTHFQHIHNLIVRQKCSTRLFCYTTSYHRTIDTRSFKFTYGMKPRLLALPTPELARLSYSEGFIAELLQILKKARQIALVKINQYQ